MKGEKKREVKKKQGRREVRNRLTSYKIRKRAGKGRHEIYKIHMNKLTHCIPL